MSVKIVNVKISMPSSGGGKVNTSPTIPDEPVNMYSYALKESAYDHAQMTSEVTLPDDGIFSFSIYVTESTTVDYILKSTTSSYVQYRQSDNRFRVTTDDGRVFNFDGLILPVNSASKIQLRLIDGGVDMYVNDSFYATRLGSHTTFTVGQIGEGVTTFNVTIGNLVSYPMLTDNSSSTNPLDMIGSNDLTFVNLKDPLTEGDYEKVTDND